MKKNSQIATILTLIIASIFLFIVVTINIGKISQKKTLISNICDGAGLLLASGLGSVATGLNQELELYEGVPETCEPNWNLILGAVMIVAGICLAAFTGGSSLVVALAIAGGVIGASIGAYMVVSDVLFAAFTEPGLLREMQAKFQNMTAEQRLVESSIQYAMFAAIDDSSWVPDRFDVDRDGLKFARELDKIPQFNHWYFQRLNALPRVGELVERFYNHLFASPPEFFTIENPMSWDLEDIYLDDHWRKEVYLLVNGTWRMADWLRDDFKPFITRLYNYGYGTTFAQDYTRPQIFEEEDDLGEMYRHIREFEEFAGGLYGLSKDDLVAGFETWFSQFYNGSDSDDDWWDQMEEWINHIDAWIAELWQRHNQIVACVQSCCYYAWDCCGGGGPCCDWECDEYSCWCVQTMGCCGSYICCGDLCGDPNCPPPVNCNTPTPPLTGSNNCCATGVPLKDGCNSSIVPPYITRLQQARESIVNFRNFIVNIYDEVEALKNNPWIYRAIYVWKDIVLNEFADVVEEESPVHMVYVKLDMDDDFKLPYITQTREWHWLVVPMICKSVAFAEGEFDITVARYDEDIAKRGPLSTFWRFKFRSRTEGEEGGEVNTLRAVADNFYNRLNDGQSCALDSLISAAQADELGNFAYNNGIAAKITVHYGPGYTYPPASLPGEAARRNEDIRISRRHK